MRLEMNIIHFRPYDTVHIRFRYLNPFEFGSASQSFECIRCVAKANSFPHSGSFAKAFVLYMQNDGSKS